MHEILSITKALSDETRVRALLSLKDGEMCPCQIIEVLSLAPSTVSKPMNVLQQARLKVLFLITVRDSANETCPVFPGKARHIHAGFDDPPRLAAGATSEEAALAHYGRLRDEIRDYVAKLPEMTHRRENGPNDAGAITAEFYPVRGRRGLPVPRGLLREDRGDQSGR